MSTSRNVDDKWRLSCKGTTDKLRYTLKHSLFTDVEFLVGPPDNVKSIKAHKYMLASWSPVFEAMFYGSLPETNTITITDIEPEAFEILLLYFYKNEIVFDNYGLALSTYEAAEKYMVSELKIKCEEYITNLEFTVENIWEILRNALLFGMIDIKDKCLIFITKNAKRALLSETFLECTYNVVQEILKLDVLNLSEKELLDALVRWAERHRGKDTLEEFLQPLLRFIRFRGLTAEEFCAFHDEQPRMLNEVDVLSILKHLTRPSSNKLPDWCSPANPRKRIHQIYPPSIKCEPCMEVDNAPIVYSVPCSSNNQMPYAAPARRRVRSALVQMRQVAPGRNVLDISNDDAEMPSSSSSNRIRPNPIHLIKHELDFLNDDSLWGCRHCTFLNPPDNQVCGACSLPNDNAM